MLPRVSGCVCLIACLGLWGCDKSAPPDQTPSGQAATGPEARATPPAPPRWACAEPVFDFGEVWAGKTVTNDFRFRNTGGGTLKILRTQPRCSCSVAKNYTKEVATGAEGVIPFLLQTSNKSGSVTEWLTIKTNDPVRPDMKITLKGTVRTVVQTEVTYDAFHERGKAFTLSPRPLNKKAKASFGRIKSEDRLHRIIKLHNTSGRPLTLTMLPIPPDTRFQITFEETVPGEEFQLTVIGEPPFPVGRWTTPIQFVTNVPEQPTYTLYAYAYVPPRVEVIPEKIVIDQRRYATKERIIRITNNGTTPVDVIAISTSDPNYDIVLLPRKPNTPKQQTIKITFPGDAYEPPPYGELIEVKTNDSEWPVIQREVLPMIRGRRPPRPPDKPLVLHPVDISNQGG